MADTKWKFDDRGNILVDYEEDGTTYRMEFLKWTQEPIRLPTYGSDDYESYTELTFFVHNEGTANLYNEIDHDININYNEVAKDLKLKKYHIPTLDDAGKTRLIQQIISLFGGYLILLEVYRHYD